MGAAMKTQVTWAAVVLVGIGCAALACERGGEMKGGKAEGAPQFVRVTIDYKMDAKGHIQNKTKKIDEKNAVAKLASYFPGVGTGKTSLEYGGYKCSAVLVFETEGGKHVKVCTNYKFWHEGSGDWPARDGLADEIAALFKE
jgi:hypothetical protein